ncbi:MAG TPA: hypothetical protein VEJ63_19280 [Planctomycetota bacterium]|nr:hypothetical protein [Planctomycetota bacterium]
MYRWSLIAVLTVVSLGAPSSTANEAAGLSDVGLTFMASGKTEKAKEVFFKALAHDVDYPIALHELGKIFETEGKNAIAADFLAKASVEFAKGEKSNPAWSGKRADATRRLKVLNPYAAQYVGAMEEYAADLGKIAKKSPDSLTAEEALRRVDVLMLPSVLPADKLPKIDRPASADPKTKRVVGRDGIREKTAKTEIAPEVERTLKAAGWTKITGVWKKVAENKYEVTDGKLECAKLNGAVQVFYHKGSTGTVRAYVRADNKESEWESDWDWKWSATGYGLVLKGQNAKIYSPSQFGSTYSPYLDHEVALPEAQNKHLMLVQIQEKRLEITLNTKREKLAEYPIAKEGVFTIIIEGTATIEDPKAAGQ